MTKKVRKPYFHGQIRKGQPFAPPKGVTRKARKRRIKKSQRSYNYWHAHKIDDLELRFSKIAPMAVEMMWLEANAPDAIISHEFVHDYQRCPAYQEGRWNGKATFVAFSRAKMNDAYSFRIAWWGTPA
jgi:hypothetical protein